MDDWSERDDSPYRYLQEPAGSCDWGHCDSPAVMWRLSDELGWLLAVCNPHAMEAGAIVGLRSGWRDG